MCRADYSVVMFLAQARPPLIPALILITAVLAACTAEVERTYPLKGQILAIGDHGRPASTTKRGSPLPSSASVAARKDRQCSASSL